MMMVWGLEWVVRVCIETAVATMEGLKISMRTHFPRVSARIVCALRNFGIFHCVLMHTRTTPTVSQVMTVDDLGGGEICLFRKPMMTSILNDPQPTALLKKTTVQSTIPDYTNFRNQIFNISSFNLENFIFCFLLFWPFFRCYIHWPCIQLKN